VTVVCVPFVAGILPPAYGQAWLAYHPQAVQCGGSPPCPDLVHFGRPGSLPGNARPRHAGAGFRL